MPNFVNSVLKWFTGASSFLSGALIGTLVTVIATGVRARRDREMAWLQEQLRSLYGPLSFFTRQNEQLFRLVGNVQDQHQKHFAGKWSEDETRQQEMVEMGQATTELGNMYVERIVKNNDRVMAILETWIMHTFGMPSAGFARLMPPIVE